MKFNKIFSVLACTALLAAGYACTEKVEPTPSPVAGNEEVYFPYTDPATISIPVNATQISVTVNRVDATEESTVALTSAVNYSEDDKVVPVTDIFTIPASVTFPKDVKEVTLEIGVDFAKVVVGREYFIDLALEEAKTGSYGLSKRVFTAMYEPWGEWELFSETEPGIYQQAAIWDYEYETPVYIRKSLINDKLTQYMVLSPFSDFEYEQIINVDETRTVEVDGVECPTVWMQSGIDTPVVNSNYGMTMSYATTYTWLKFYFKGGGQFENDDEIYAFMAGQNSSNIVFNVSYYNPVQGRFYLYMTPYLINGDGPFNEALETLQLPGTYHDYYFTFNHEGNMVSTNGTEYALVQVVPSTDVDHFACEVLPGSLSEEEITKAQDALASDGDVELIYDATYTISYPFEEAGTYTVIAVGFDDKGELVCRGAEAFDFETVQAAPEWHTLGYVDYTDGIFVGLFLNELGIETWDVEVQEHNETEGLYRMVNPYAEWPLLGELEWSLVKGNHYITINAENPDAVYMPTSEPGVYVPTTCPRTNAPFGNITVMSQAYYLVATEQLTFEQAFKQGLFGTMKDDVVTFPAGGLFIVEESGKWLFYGNLDPTAPDDAGIDYGQGCFALDFARLSEAPARKVQHKKVLPNVYEMKKMVASKAVKADKKALLKTQKPTKEEIRQARMQSKRSL